MSDKKYLECAIVYGKTTVQEARLGGDDREEGTPKGLFFKDKDSAIKWAMNHLAQHPSIGELILLESVQTIRLRETPIVCDDIKNE